LATLFNYLTTKPTIAQKVKHRCDGGLALSKFAAGARALARFNALIALNGEAA
jgi:hypothetical protein